MTKLHFDYIDSANELRAEYRGLVIRAVQDSDCNSPWQDSDGMTPLIWTNGDGLNDDAQGYDIESPFADKSNAWISRHWTRLLHIVAPDCDAAKLSAELAEAIRDNPPQWRAKLGDLKRETLEERLADMKPSGRYGCWSQAADYFTALEELWTMQGVAVLDFQRNGYSQGDTVRGLLVALPAWRKAMGIKAGADMKADLESQADTFGAWAFGDCFGFVIEAADSDGDPDGDSLDSCWGFIGDDMEKSGLAEAARDSADYILASAAKRKAGKLKELIRNHVPLHARPAILAEAAKLESA